MKLNELFEEMKNNFKVNLLDDNKTIFIDLPFDLYETEIKAPLYVMEGKDDKVIFTDFGRVLEYIEEEYDIDENFLDTKLKALVNRFGFSVVEDNIEFEFPAEFFADGLNEFLYILNHTVNTLKPKE